jgi:hypothetical protein
LFEKSIFDKINDEVSVNDIEVVAPEIVSPINEPLFTETGELNSNAYVAPAPTADVAPAPITPPVDYDDF